MIRNNAGTLSARGEYAMIMDWDNGMKAANNEQVRRDERLKAGQTVYVEFINSIILGGSKRCLEILFGQCVPCVHL